MDEKKLESVQELNDAQLEDVSGGLYPVERFGHLYVFVGSEADSDKAFLCPKCYSGLTHGKIDNTDLWRCPKCQRNYFTKEALMNTGTGLWKQMFY